MTAARWSLVNAQSCEGNTHRSDSKPFDSVLVCYVAKVFIQQLPIDRWPLETGFFSLHLSHENQLPPPLPV